MKIISAIVALFFVFSLVTCAYIEPAYFKHVQGGPEEFDLHQLPDPESSTLTSDTALFPVVFTKNADGKYEWAADLPFDSTQEVILTIISRIKDYQIMLSKPTKFENDAKHFLSLQEVSDEKEESWFGVNEKDSAPAISYTIKNPVAGVHTLHIITSEVPTNSDPSKPSMFVMLYNRSPMTMESHLHGDYHQLLVNEDINMQTRAFDSVAFQALLASMNLTSPVGSNGKHIIKPEPYVSNYLTAEIDVIMPNGEEKIIPMHDDGLHADNSANDGIFGGSFKATQEGTYTTNVVMRGVTPDGHVFTRTTQHIYTVIENDALVIEKQAAASVNVKEEMMKIFLRLTYDESKKAAVMGQKYRAYAEVWGSSAASSNDFVPVAFVTGMTVAEPSIMDGGDNGILMLELQMSMKWLSKAKANLPLELRNVYVQDSANNIPVAKSDAIQITMDMVNIVGAEHLAQQVNDKKLFAQAVVNSLTETRFKFENVITEEMQWGVRPAKYQLQNKRQENNGTNDDAVLILVHGYCASDSPWETSHFTNYVVFEDLKQSRTHDDFAILIREFADKHQTFSLASHSQGGPASLHLKSFYWSNIDDAAVNNDDHRDIQTVGSPWYGNAMAGTLASIGNFLGIGCGPNYDLTRDGARLWISSIPAAARKHIYYYTTQYKKFSWCNLAANLVLSWANDGTAELKYSDLEHANDKGHSIGECHSTGMKYPPQCKNAARNAEINKKASRGVY